MDGYSSIDDAVAAALYAVRQQELADKYEYLGLIYQDPDTGEYLFTDPKTQGSGKKVGASFTIPGGSLRAIYHNHPALPGRKDEHRYEFSKGDMNTIEDFDVPGYIGVDEEIFVRHPGEKKMKLPQHSLGLNSYVPKSAGGQRGTPVLARIPIELIKQRKLSDLLRKKDE